MELAEANLPATRLTTNYNIGPTLMTIIGSTGS